MTTQASDDGQETQRLQVPAAPSAPALPEVVLRVLTGVEAGRTLVVKSSSAVAGRSPDIDLVLDETGVSRRHARIDCRPDGLVSITDLQSTNGTLVNDERIEMRVLQIGDIISLGGGVSLQLEAVNVKAPRNSANASTQDARKTLVLGPAERIGLECARALAARRSLHLAFVYIDLPQTLQGGIRHEDVYGEIKQRLRRRLRASDQLGRFDDEVIFLLVNGLQDDDAHTFFEAFLAELDKTQVAIPTPDGFDLRVRLEGAIGYVSVESSPDPSAQALIAMATEALRAARDASDRRLRCATAAPPQ